ncbi:unnamed protein product [Prunus brigantina]
MEAISRLIRIHERHEEEEREQKKRRRTIWGCNNHIIPTTRFSIASLESKESQNNGECSICLDEFSEGEQVTQTPCKHKFHEDCILKWLNGKHFCPMCRFQLPTKVTKDAMNKLILGS